MGEANDDMDPSERLDTFLRALWAADGRPERDGDDDLLGVVVRMMLGQATSKANAGRAFDELLMRFGGEWHQIAKAATSDVAEAIAIGGLAKQKAPRIRALLTRVREDFGDYTLEPLREMTVEGALDYLLAVKGVGPTTARFALMYAVGMNVMPINGGIRRCLERVGVVEPTWSSDRMHREVSALVDDAYAAHMTLVRHARTTCRPTPLCQECSGSEHCRFAAGR